MYKIMHMPYTAVATVQALSDELLSKQTETETETEYSTYC